MRASTEGWIAGAIGMLIFSGSMPATRVAVADFSPLFLTAARAALPGVLSLVALWAFRAAPPRREDLRRLVLVALCVVLGFPILSALALTRITAAHSLIWIGLLPLVTASFGVVIAGERMGRAFWAYSIAGAACIVLYAAAHAGSGEGVGDALMLAAVISAGLGYAEGARLSRRLGGWAVISWALALALPLSLPLAIALAPSAGPPLASPSWPGLIYVALFSMWIGFFFWYRGLALGGIAAIGQLQLLQPFFGLMISAALLKEPVDAATIAAALAVLVSVTLARRAALAPRAVQPQPMDFLSRTP